MTDRRTAAATRYHVGYWLGHCSLDAGGTAPYSWRVLQALLDAADERWSFTVLYSPPAETVIARLDRKRSAVTFRPVPHPPKGLRRLWFAGKRCVTAVGTRLAIPALARVPASYLDTFFASLSLDLLHLPVPVRLNARHRPPFVVTIHDLQELHFPQYFSPAERARRALELSEIPLAAEAVVVSYDHVKRDVVTYCAVPEDRVHVFHIPLSSMELATSSVEASDRLREKYESWRPFLLYPAQTWRHKNHARLLHALARVRREHGLDLRLICTGRQTELYEELAAEIARLGLMEHVWFTGVVPEAELSWLYEHARLVVIPTEYEAGSFPLMEAMMRGAPVLCSNVTSLPETIGDRRFVFDPYDVAAMALCIVKLATDEGLRAENVLNSGERVEALRRGTSGAQLLAILRAEIERLRSPHGADAHETDVERPVMAPA